jgi:uncharacterized protein YacL (UPF0231 family)
MGSLNYRLKLPNREVTIALNDMLFDGYTELEEQKVMYQKECWAALNNGLPEDLVSSIRRLFAAIPWRNFTGNDLTDMEGYYASVLYAFFSAINCTVIAEDVSCHGQVDLTVKCGMNIFVIEIKVESNTGKNQNLAEESNTALQQIMEKGYSKKYSGFTGVCVFEIGLIFAARQRNLSGFAWRKSGA